MTLAKLAIVNPNPWAREDPSITFPHAAMSVALIKKRGAETLYTADRLVEPIDGQDLYSPLARKPSIQHAHGTEPLSEDSQSLSVDTMEGLIRLNYNRCLALFEGLSEKSRLWLAYATDRRSRGFDVDFDTPEDKVGCLVATLVFAHCQDPLLEDFEEEYQAALDDTEIERNGQNTTHKEARLVLNVCLFAC